MQQGKLLNTAIFLAEDQNCLRPSFLPVAGGSAACSYESHVTISPINFLFLMRFYLAFPLQLGTGIILYFGIDKCWTQGGTNHSLQWHCKTDYSRTSTHSASLGCSLSISSTSKFQGVDWHGIRQQLLKSLGHRTQTMRHPTSWQ